MSACSCGHDPDFEAERLLEALERAAIISKDHTRVLAERDAALAKAESTQEHFTLLNSVNVFLKAERDAGLGRAKLYERTVADDAVEIEQLKDRAEKAEAMLEEWLLRLPDEAKYTKDTP